MTSKIIFETSHRPKTPPVLHHDREKTKLTSVLNSLPCHILHLLETLETERFSVTGTHTLHTRVGTTMSTLLPYLRLGVSRDISRHQILVVGVPTSVMVAEEINVLVPLHSEPVSLSYTERPSVRIGSFTRTHG